MGPLRSGFTYGIVAVFVAIAADLRFVYLGPSSTPAWILAAVESYRTQLALAAFVFLAVLAALRVRPTRVDPDVPYRSVLIRDCALAATVIGVMAGATLFLLTAVQATVLDGAVRTYAEQAAPHIKDYVDEVRSELSDPPPPTTVREVEVGLQPPVLRDLGRSIANIVLRAILLGAVGAAVGALRRADGGSPAASGAASGSGGAKTA